MNSVILSAGTRYLVWLLLFFSLYMLLRGHNEPGGGFIGGLIGATGFVVDAVARGPAATRRTLRLEPSVIAMLGLGVALAAGVAAVFFDDPFFTGQWLFIGGDADEKGLPISTVLAFDVGVYMVVFGSVLTLVFALEEEAV